MQNLFKYSTGLKFEYVSNTKSHSHMAKSPWRCMFWEIISKLLWISFGCSIFRSFSNWNAQNSFISGLSNGRKLNLPKLSVFVCIHGIWLCSNFWPILIHYSYILPNKEFTVTFDFLKFVCFQTDYRFRFYCLPLKLTLVYISKHHLCNGLSQIRYISIHATKLHSVQTFVYWIILLICLLKTNKSRRTGKVEDRTDGSIQRNHWLRSFRTVICADSMQCIPALYSHWMELWLLSNSMKCKETVAQSIRYYHYKSTERSFCVQHLLHSFILKLQTLWLPISSY